MLLISDLTVFSGFPDRIPNSNLIDRDTQILHSKGPRVPVSRVKNKMRMTYAHGNHNH